MSPGMQDVTLCVSTPQTHLPTGLCPLTFCCVLGGSSALTMFHMFQKMEGGSTITIVWRHSALGGKRVVMVAPLSQEQEVRSRESLSQVPLQETSKDDVNGTCPPG